MDLHQGPFRDRNHAASQPWWIGLTSARHWVGSDQKSESYPREEGQI